MRIRPGLSQFVIAVAIGITLLASTIVSAEDEVQFSDAETMLWLTDQLKTIAKPTLLTYNFERSGTLEGAFEDTVKFSVNSLQDNGMKGASLEFFTGERRFDVPAAESTNVNPILKVYLQGDVYEMNRLTDPKGESRERWRYFQRRIKFALSEAATITDTTISHAGVDYAAKVVEFTPYAKDPKRSLFEEFADKTYEITIAEKLPGYLYQIKTVIPGAAQNASPLISEVLTLAAIEEL